MAQVEIGQNQNTSGCTVSRHIFQPSNSAVVDSERHNMIVNCTPGPSRQNTSSQQNVSKGMCIFSWFGSIVFE